ncbi:G5 domain-containing protein [Streptococcus suis]|nr:G5 domain-containing protein [Streptococcus suis]
MRLLSGISQHRYSLRKTSYGLVSATIAGLFLVQSLIVAQPVEAQIPAKMINYRYIMEDELTADERKLMIHDLPKLVEETDDTYYLIYRPTVTSSTSQLLLPDTGESLTNYYMGALVGVSLLLVAIKKGKNLKKELSGIIIVTATGVSLLSPTALSLTNQTLEQYNQVLSASVGENLPEPLQIDGYRYIGYIKDAHIYREKEHSVVLEVPSETSSSVKSELSRITETRDIGSMATTISDHSQSGVSGERSITTRTYTANGQVLKTEEVSNVVTKATVSEIVQVGTKVETAVPTDAPTYEVPSIEVVESDTIHTEPIAYETVEVENPHLLLGERRISQSGVSGERSITTRTYTANGQVLKTEEVSNVVTQAAVSEIVQVGTKVKEAPVLTISQLIKNENLKMAQVQFSLADPTRTYVSAVAQLYQGNHLIREVPITNLAIGLDLTGLDYYVDYTLKTVVTYDLGNGQENQEQTSIKDFRLDYKKIEIKDIDRLELYGLENGNYRRYISMASLPQDLDQYFVKIQSDRFKEILLPISAVEEVEVNGQSKYKFTVVFDELVQENNASYQDNYTFYIEKQTTSQSGVYTSFKELVAAIEADPTGTYIIGADMTADEISLSDTALSYISSPFTGSLTGSYNGQSYAIYHLTRPLFDTLNGARVSDLDLIDVAIAVDEENIGSLARIATASQLSNVSVEGSISARANIGGIVYLANKATKITNSSFTGQLIGIGATHASNIGGVVGYATDNDTILNQVHANSAISLSANRGYRVGGMVGHLTGNATLRNGVATGSIVNLTTAGHVGGVVGSVYSGGTVNNIVSSVRVVNGDKIHGDTAYSKAPITNTFVTSQSDGANDSWSTAISDADAATRVAAMEISTNLSDSLINQAVNFYSVDYSQVAGAKISHTTAYKNMEKLLPFYNKEYLVYYANKLNLTDKLNQTLLLDVVPMVDNQIVTDPYSQKRFINRIMLHYADGTVEYLDVAFKEDFKNNHIADYTIIGTDLLYTPESFLSNYDSLVVQLSNELSNLVFDSEAIKNTLKISQPANPTPQQLSAWAADLGVSSTTEQKPLWALYLEDSFNSVRNNLAEELRKLLASNNAINTLGSSVQTYLLQKIVDNKEALVLGLAYLNRWYNIDFGNLNTQDLTVFKQDFFGNQEASTLDVIIALGNSGYDNLRPKNNVLTYGNSLKSAKGPNTVFDYLENYRQLFLPTQTNNEWLKNTSRAYIVESQSNIDEVATKQATATPNSKYTIGVYDRITKSNWLYQNMLLPLLTLPEESMYIISTMSTLSFGAYDRYLYDNASSGMEFIDYMHQLVDRAAIWQRDHFDFWYSILSESSREKLFQSLLNYDGFNFRDSAKSATWKTLQNTERSSIANFFGPVGKWYAANGSGAYATGYLTHFVASRMLDQYGSSVFTHEMVHNFDGNIYFEGNGRRQGQGAELFAQGLLQTPIGNQSRSLGINTMFTGNEDSLNRYHAANPVERYKNVEDLNEYVHNMFDAIYLLDYLEAKSVLKQSDTVKQKWYRVIDNYYVQNAGRDTHAGNSIRPLTLEEAAALTNISDLVDKSIINRREYWNANSGLTRNGYYNISIFSPIYSALSNPNGSPGDVMFRRMAYELLAEKGYVEGFVPYVSNQLSARAMADGSIIYDNWSRKNVGLITDDLVFEHIFKGEYESWKDFKKAMYQQRINQLNNLIDFTITYELGQPNSTKQINITSFAELEKLMDQAVAQDMKNIDTSVANHNTSWVNALKQRIYNALLRTTNDFTSSIFK